MFPSGMLRPPWAALLRSELVNTVGGGPGGIFREVPGISIIHRRRVFFGRLIKRNMGKYLRNRILIQLGME